MLTDKRYSALFQPVHCQNLTIANQQHAVNRIWTCAEPIKINWFIIEIFSIDYFVRLCWMELCSNDKHCTTMSQQPCKYNYVKLSNWIRKLVSKLVYIWQRWFGFDRKKKCWIFGPSLWNSSFWSKKQRCLTLLETQF